LRQPPDLALPDSLWASENLTCCRRLRQRGDQVFASALPLKAQLHIKHFLAAIVGLFFSFKTFV
jgi:hypothetical protein